MIAFRIENTSELFYHFIFFSCLRLTNTTPLSKYSCISAIPGKVSPLINEPKFTEIGALKISTVISPCSLVKKAKSKVT